MPRAPLHLPRPRLLRRQLDPVTHMDTCPPRRACDIYQVVQLWLKNAITYVILTAYLDLL